MGKRFMPSFLGEFIGGGFSQILCNFSTYFNGTSNVNVPFEGDPLLPATGYTNLNNDYVKVDFTGSTFNFSDGFTETNVIDIRAEYGLFQWIWSYGIASSNRMYFLCTSSTAAQLTIVVGGVFTNISISGIDIFSIRKIVASCSYADPRNAKTITLTLYDADDVVLGTNSSVADLTLDFIPTQYTLGTRSILDHRAAINVYSDESDHLGVFDYNIRLWGENDPNGGKIISDLGYEAVLQDDTPFNAIYPYFESKWPTSYLVEDKVQIGSACVTVPAGQEIVTNLTIPVTNGGVVVTNDI